MGFTDTDAAELARPAPPASGAGRPMRRGAVRPSRWAALLAAGWLVQVAVRLWLGWDQTAPVANPDETGYLFAARVLAGGPDADLSGSTFYQPGYSLLLAPAFWLSDDPETGYRLIVLINSLISSALLPLGYLALRRLELSRPRAYALATVTALLPGVIFYTQFALTDAVFPVVILGWLLLLHSWLSGRGGAAHAAGASLLAAYTYSMHSRGLIVLIVHAGLLAVVVWRRWAPRRQAAVAWGAVVASAGAAWLANAWLQPRTYPDGIKPLGNWLTDRLTSLDGLGWTTALAGGQIWYLVVSTYGIAGVGLVAMTALVLRRHTGEEAGLDEQADRADRVTAAVVLVTVIGIACVTSAALPDERRVGNFVYGRYLACLAPVLVLAGCALAARAGRRALVRAGLAAGGLALATGVLAALHAGDRLSRFIFVGFDFPETSVLTADWGALKLWLAMIVALVLLAALVALCALPWRYGRAAALLLTLAVCLGSAYQITDRISRPLVRGTRAVDLAAAGLRGSDVVAVELNLPWKARLPMTYQVSRSEVRRFDAAKGPVPAGATLVIVRWDLGTAARQSWATAPAGWRPVAERRTGLGDWVAWRHAG